MNCMEVSKKIFVIGTRGIPGILGGIETHCEELYPRLVKLGYNVTVIRRSFYVKPNVDWSNGVEDDMWQGVKLVDIQAPRLKAFEAIVHTAKAIFYARRHGADLVHIHAIGPSLLAPLARLLGMKVVMTHHGPDYERDKWGGGAKTMLKLGQWLGCKSANHVIVISEVIKHLIATRCGRTKAVSLIYNGVPSPDICIDPYFFRKLGIKEGRYVLVMCRFEPEKRLHDLLEAFVLLKKRHGIDEDVKLVLAGDSVFEEDYPLELKRRCREYGVVLPGFVKGSNQHSLLSNALCYVLPSSHEGLPIALLEAMSYRLPVIASAIPANLEVGLPQDCYFKVGDVEALSEKIEEIARRPLTRIEYDMTKYNWDQISQQVACLYDSL